MRLAPQQRALNLALEQFSDDNGGFDRDLWEQAFTSTEPEQIVAVKAVTGLYEGLVNHLVEMLHAAARLCALEVAVGDERPNGPELFAAVCVDGGLTANQADVLGRLYTMRNELQHASPSVDADEVYDSIELLTKTLKRFTKSYIDWLKRHGVTLV
jgi:hypothetical protein